MDLLLVVMAAFILFLVIQIRKQEKRICALEGMKAAFDVLVDDVSEIHDDFYGSAAR